MRQQKIDVTAQSHADPEAVYELIATGASWTTWSPIDSFTLERAGDKTPEGVGAIRVFWTGRVTSREQIVELVPGRRLSYVLLSGMPIRGYRADIDIEPADDGCVISWHSRFTPMLFGTGWFYRWFLTHFVQRCADGVAAHASASWGQHSR